MDVGDARQSDESPLSPRSVDVFRPVVVVASSGKTFQANLVYSLQPLWSVLFAVVLLKVGWTQAKSDGNAIFVSELARLIPNFQREEQQRVPVVCTTCIM